MEAVIDISKVSKIISYSLFYALKDTFKLSDSQVKNMNKAFDEAFKISLMEVRDQDSYMDTFIDLLKKTLIDDLDLTKEQQEKLNSSLESYLHTFRHISKSEL